VTPDDTQKKSPAPEGVMGAGRSSVFVAAGDTLETAATISREGNAMNATPAGADTLDILWGVASIAEYLRMPPRRARYLISLGAMPVARCGRHVIASRATLRQIFSELLNGEGPADAPPQT
jgi:hypothetical protein